MYLSFCCLLHSQFPLRKEKAREKKQQRWDFISDRFSQAMTLSVTHPFTHMATCGQWKHPGQRNGPLGFSVFLIYSILFRAESNFIQCNSSGFKKKIKVGPLYFIVWLIDIKTNNLKTLMILVKNIKNKLKLMSVTCPFWLIYLHCFH